MFKIGDRVRGKGLDGVEGLVENADSHGNYCVTFDNHDSFWLGEGDLELVESYSATTSSAPECHCTSMALISTGHDSTCPYNKPRKLTYAPDRIHPDDRY